jgi:hypothetical protein
MNPRVILTHGGHLRKDNQRPHVLRCVQNRFGHPLPRTMMMMKRTLKRRMVTTIVRQLRMRCTEGKGQNLCNARCVSVVLPLIA